jgi:hypothetical protein
MINKLSEQQGPLPIINMEREKRLQDKGSE